MLRLGIPVIGVTDLPRAVAFWTEALPLVAVEEWKSDLAHAGVRGRLRAGPRSAAQ
ncbi:VOC family protein [Streptomyces violaceorubidus]